MSIDADDAAERAAKRKQEREAYPRGAVQPGHEDDLDAAVDGAGAVQQVDRQRRRLRELLHGAAGQGGPGGLGGADRNGIKAAGEERQCSHDSVLGIVRDNVIDVHCDAGMI